MQRMIAVIGLLAILAGAVQADVSIPLVDKATYAPGEVMRLGVDVRVSQAVLVDMYVAAIGPDGSLRCLALDGTLGANGAITSILPGMVATNLFINPALDVTLPADLAEGEYLWYMVLCRMGGSVLDGANWVAYGTAAWTVARPAVQPTLSLVQFVELPGTHSQVLFHPGSTLVTMNGRAPVEQAGGGSLYYFFTYDAATGELVNTLTCNEDVRNLYISADGASLYADVYNWDVNVRDNEFRRYDAATGLYVTTLTQASFQGVVMTDGTPLTYVGQKSNPISVDRSLYYRPLTTAPVSSYNELVASTINTDGSIGEQAATAVAVMARPVSVSVSPDGKKIFVLNDDFTGSGQSVTIFTTDPFAMSKVVTVASSMSAFPVGPAVGPDGTAYVARTNLFYINGENHSSAYIDAIDPVTDELVNVNTLSVPNGEAPASQYYGIAVSSDGKYLALVGSRMDTGTGYGLWLYATGK